MKRQVRSRPITIKTKIKIVHQPRPVNVKEEDAKAAEAPPSTPTAANMKMQMIDIPVPVVHQVTNYDREIPADHTVGSLYIRYCPLSLEEEEEYMDYELDNDDINWIDNHPKFGRAVDPSLRLSYEDFQRIIDLYERGTFTRSEPLTAIEADRQFSERYSNLHLDHEKLFLEIRSYWMSKKQKLKKSLVRRYWPVTPVSDTNPHLVFRPRGKEKYKLRKHRKGDDESFKKLLDIKDGLEHALQILELVQKKEELKLKMIEFKHEEFLQRVHDIVNPGEPRKLTVDPPEGLDDILRYKPASVRQRNPENLERFPERTVRKRTVEQTVDLDRKLAFLLQSKIWKPREQPPSLVLGPASDRSLQCLNPSFTPAYHRQLSNVTEPAIPTYPPSKHTLVARARIGRNRRHLIDLIPSTAEQRQAFHAERFLSRFPFFDQPSPVPPQIPPDHIIKDYEPIHYPPPPPVVARVENTNVPIPFSRVSWSSVIENTKNVVQPATSYQVLRADPIGVLPERQPNSEILRFTI